MKKNRDIKKRFYVASPAMNPLSSNGRNVERWGKETLKDAVAHATELARATGEAQLVVQVVRVVRPVPAPVVVEG